MKNRYYSFIAATALFAVACTNKYEAAIADYVQTIDGTKVDLGFSLKQADEVKKLTVADSILILNDESSKVLAENINAAEAQLTQFQQNLVLEQTKTRSNKTMVDAFMKTIEKKQAEIDSLKQVKPAPITKYEGRKSDEVLAVIVEAKYKAKDPQADNNVAEVTSQFVLSPDGSLCLGKIENTENKEDSQK